MCLFYCFRVKFHCGPCNTLNIVTLGITVGTIRGCHAVHHLGIHCRFSCEILYKGGGGLLYCTKCGAHQQGSMGILPWNFRNEFTGKLKKKLGTPSSLQCQLEFFLIARPEQIFTPLLTRMVMILMKIIGNVPRRSKQPVIIRARAYVGMVRVE